MPQSRKQPKSEQSDPSRTESRATNRTPAAAARESLAGELAQHGITSVPITFFDWGGYRYSNAGDAIAAAKRGARK